MDDQRIDREGWGGMSDNQKRTGAVALIAILMGLSYWNVYAPLIPLGALVIYWLAVWMRKINPTT
jgi:hypothetical protein